MFFRCGRRKNALSPCNRLKKRKRTGYVSLFMVKLDLKLDFVLTEHSYKKGVKLALVYLSCYALSIY